MNRSRSVYLLAAMVVVVLGLASRKFAGALPAFVGDYAGDTLWGLLVFLLIVMVFPKWSAQRIFVSTVGFAFAIELSQLYHAPWIDHVRDTTLGGLVLGYGFLWSDLVCYVAGAAAGYGLDKRLSGDIEPTKRFHI
ncbi:MAG TPA: DUF2809 domain-containing protein [Terriglobales bacterium]|nr:DUF2809 domain-containing protein [Terriglobales bacterium]